MHISNNIFSFISDKKDVNIEKGEEFFHIKEKPTAVILKEFFQTGARIQYNSMGDMKGKLSGTYMETTDVDERMDGNNNWEVRAMNVTKEGDIVMISGNGTGKQTMGSTTSTFTGECNLMTMASSLSWLNNKKVWVEGTSRQ